MYESSNFASSQAMSVKVRSLPFRGKSMSEPLR